MRVTYAPVDRAGGDSISPEELERRREIARDVAAFVKGDALNLPDLTDPLTRVVARSILQGLTQDKGKSLEWGRWNRLNMRRLKVGFNLLEQAEINALDPKSVETKEVFHETMAEGKGISKGTSGTGRNRRRTTRDKFI